MVARLRKSIRNDPLRSQAVRLVYRRRRVLRISLGCPPFSFWSGILAENAFDISPLACRTRSRSSVALHLEMRKKPRAEPNEHRQVLLLSVLCEAVLCAKMIRGAHLPGNDKHRQRDIPRNTVYPEEPFCGTNFSRQASHEMARRRSFMAGVLARTLPGTVMLSTLERGLQDNAIGWSGRKAGPRIASEPRI